MTCGWVDGAGGAIGWLAGGALVPARNAPRHRSKGPLRYPRRHARNTRPAAAESRRSTTIIATAEPPPSPSSSSGLADKLARMQADAWLPEGGGPALVLKSSPVDDLILPLSLAQSNKSSCLTSSGVNVGSDSSTRAAAPLT